MVRPSGYAASAVLAGIAALHVAWGRGSAFPCRSRSELADVVVGAPEVPPPAACCAVAVALLVASSLTADLPIGPRSLRRWGRASVASVLAARGILGLLGRTDIVAPGSASPRFRQLDRGYYAPLCLALSAAVATAA